MLAPRDDDNDVDVDDDDDDNGFGRLSAEVTKKTLTNDQN